MKKIAFVGDQPSSFRFQSAKLFPGIELGFLLFGIC